MKILVALLALTVTGADKAPNIGKRVFSCSLGQKQVSVHAVGNELVYEFGTNKKIELKIIGSVARRNVFFRTDRFANIENQLRFINGRFSYIVFSVGGNPSSGAHPLSGLTVMNGTKPVSELTCRKFTELDSSSFKYSQLPIDSEKYSAM